MSIACEVLSFEVTTFSRAFASDRYHSRRYWCEIRRAGTDDTVHTTEEFVVPNQASAAAHAWIDQQGGRTVGRPIDS